MNGSDNMNYLDKQIRDAKNNYNYFFVKLIFGILSIIFNLSIMLLISSVFNYVIINIIALFYTIYSFFKIINICKYYFSIINDIKNTLGYSDLFFEIDFSLFDNNIFKGVVKYGK